MIILALLVTLSLSSEAAELPSASRLAAQSYVDSSILGNMTSSSFNQTVRQIHADLMVNQALSDEMKRQIEGKINRTLEAIVDDMELVSADNFSSFVEDYAATNRTIFSIIRGSYYTEADVKDAGAGMWRIDNFGLAGRPFSFSFFVGGRPVFFSGLLLGPTAESELPFEGGRVVLRLQGDGALELTASTAGCGPFRFNFIKA